MEEKDEGNYNDLIKIRKPKTRQKIVKNFLFLHLLRGHFKTRKHTMRIVKAYVIKKLLQVPGDK